MKLFKNKLAVTIIVLSVTFLGLIIYTSNSSQKGVVSSGVATVTNPLQKVLHNMNKRLKTTVDFFLNFSEVKEENKNLTKENIELKNKLLEYDKFKEEIERLRELLNFADSKITVDYIGSEIIGYSGESFSKGYILDKGEKHGLAKGMAIISNKGLVGKITSVGSNWAIAESLISENVSVAVMVDSTRETTGILSGYKNHNDENLAVVTNLPINSEIKEGDVILTSGLGQIYPKEIRIGEVISVGTDEVKVMKTAIVKPYVDFNKLEEIFAVVPKETRDIKYEN